MEKIYKILQFIIRTLCFIFFLDKKENMLLLAQDGNAVDQLKFAKYLHSRNDYVNAYAWAETARYQGIVEAEKFKMQLWDLIPEDRKFNAQNLARNFRIKYTNNIR